NPPELLHAKLPHLRLAPLGQAELAYRRARQMAPATLSQHDRARLDVRPRLEVRQRLAVLAAALVARAHAHHAPVLHYQLRGRGLGEDVRAALLCPALLVARERGYRDDLIAVVLERRRSRNANLAFRRRREVDGLLGDFAEGEALLAPLLARHVAKQLLQGTWAHDSAGQVVPAARLRL